jgi:leucyl aminopeptidase
MPDRAMRVSVTARHPRQVRADAVVVPFALALHPRRLPYVEHLRERAGRLVVGEPGALTWLESRRMASPRVLMACIDTEIDDEQAGLCGSMSSEASTAEGQRSLRRLGGMIERACDQLALRKVVIACGDVDPVPLLEGMLLRAHASTEFVPDEEASSVDEVIVCTSREALSRVKERITRTVAIVEATNFTRTLADLPANIGTPGNIVARAKRATAAYDVRSSVITAARARKLGMGLFCAVAAGSGTPASVLVLEHNAAARRELPTLVLIGKGVTHDTGGYNLKRTARLHELTYDKAGAAAVIGAMQAIARLGIAAHVVGVAPLVENCIGPHAYKPGDVLTALDGTTVFVENTDAEGRLVLADCLTWVSRFNPGLVIDIATLTAASDTALGPSFAALFTNDDDARAMLLEAGYDTGELLWPMPIHASHRKALRHHLAHLRNMGSQSGAASSAAAFLRHFTRYPWAHIDMAGKGVNGVERDDLGAGATGFGTRLLVHAAEAFARRAAGRVQEST